MPLMIPPRNQVTRPHAGMFSILAIVLPLSYPWDWLLSKQCLLSSLPHPWLAPGGHHGSLCAHLEWWPGTSPLEGAQAPGSWLGEQRKGEWRVQS